jgi:hypothetical protein
VGKRAGFPLLDKSFIDRLLIVVLDPFLINPFSDPSEFKWLSKKYHDIIRKVLWDIVDGSPTPRWDMEGWSIFFFTTLLRNTLLIYRNHRGLDSGWEPQVDPKVDPGVPILRGTITCKGAPKFAVPA